MQAQLGADFVQMVPTGLPISGSSSVPTLTMNTSGRGSASLNTGAPHWGQKERNIVAPLSATEVKTARSPVVVSAALKNIALAVPLPAPRYWQTRHQHTR